MNKTVIFYVNKDTGRLHSYQVSDISIEEAAIAVKNYNEATGPGYTKLAHIVTNQHVIDAIVQKENFNTVVGRIGDVIEGLTDICGRVDDVRNLVEGLEHFVKGNKDE